MRYGGFRRGRKTSREQLQANLAAERFYAGSLPENDPRIRDASERLDDLTASIPPKRHRLLRPVDGKPAVPLEKEIVTEVLRALRNDPRVAYVWRQSTGLFQDGDRYIRTGPSGLPDLIGFLKGSGRAIFIEVKRPGHYPDERQKALLETFKMQGAIAGYCWSAEQALKLLP